MHIQIYYHLGYYSAPLPHSRVLRSMQMLVDFFPLLLFLGAFLYSGDLLVGLQVLMVAMPVAFLIKWWMTRKIDKILLGSTVVLLVMGTVSLVTRNADFLLWKPTVFYWILSVVFLGSQFIGQKPVAQRMFGSVGEMPLEQWRKLNLAWVLFFVAAGFLNLYVALNFTQKFWAYFKVFGFTAITFVFIVGQVIWLTRHIKEIGPGQSEAD
jgi:intracellular septation protein